ncbi:MAG: hypothetical protein CML91_04380 [Rhodobiaceae bacterium]|nr:hypothetical protein [Rhodobiaceae bacterium]
MKLIYELLIRITVLLGIISYLLTVGIAFVKNGFVIGVLSASLPLISNTYWTYALWNESDKFYEIYVNGQILLFILIILSIALHKLKS